MPSYSFHCKKCQLYFDKYYSFEDFDKIVLPKLVPCDSCGSTKKVEYIFQPPNINLGNTIGACAERNSKSLGGKIGEEQAEKIEKQNKNKPKKPWYGTMSKKKQREIFGDNNPKTKQEKINRYIEKGI